MGAWPLAPGDVGTHRAPGLAERWLVWRLRKCRPVTDNDLLALLADCRQRVGVRTALPSGGDGPGPQSGLVWLRPLVVAVADAGDGEARAEQQRYVLLHELAHLRRWTPGSTGCSACFASSTGSIRWCGTRSDVLRRDRELACDELVLTLTQGEGKDAYGQTIIRLLELGMDGANSPALTGIAENKENSKGEST